jgi:hypothetical protein
MRVMRGGRWVAITLVGGEGDDVLTQELQLAADMQVPAAEKRAWGGDQRLFMGKHRHKSSLVSMG